MTDLDFAFSRPIAHRGLHNAKTGIIENSMPAFERAIEGGYGIECDIQMSGDGVPMVFHDDTLDRLTDQKGAVSKLSAGQLKRIALKDCEKQSHIPTLQELVDLADEKTPLIVELKHQKSGSKNIAQAVTQLAKTTLREQSKILFFKSFDPNILIDLRAAGHDGPIGIVTEKFDNDYARKNYSFKERFYLRHLLHFPKTRFDFVSCAHQDLRMPAILLAKNSGRKVMTWTVRSEADEQRARQTADQIVFEGYIPRIGK